MSIKRLDHFHKKIVRRIRPILQPRKKVFCIGRNKTGTTSLARALYEAGYIVGRQSQAELLIDDWARRDFSRIIAYCKTADAFQDIPFSLDYTFQAVDQAFPGSKFILTVRDNSEVWYTSLVNYHAKVFGNGHIPSEEDLAQATYRKPGWILKVQKLVYGYPNIPLYDKKAYMQHYEAHVIRVLDYFQHRPADLLILNVAHADAYKQFCKFLNLSKTDRHFPWLNKSQ